MSLTSSSSLTAATVRLLLIIDAADRTGSQRISDLDLSRLAYFTDAFSKLWGLQPLDRYRLKSDQPRSLIIRQSLDRLVSCGIVVPSNIQVEPDPAPHLSAVYTVNLELAGPILDSITATDRGRREAQLVNEVVFASSGMLNEHLQEAVVLDAGYADLRLGPNDVIDLEDPASGTSAVARLFDPAVASTSLREAELIHLYMSYLESRISGE